MNELVNHMADLPIELYAKIMYGSGICSPEAQLIKFMNYQLIIPFDRVEWMVDGKSYVRHLVEMGVLQTNFDYIDYIYIVGL